MARTVTSPYVTLRVGNDLGQEVTQGFYEGAPVPENANADDVERLTRKGMLSDDSKASKSAPAESKPAAAPTSTRKSN